MKKILCICFLLFLCAACRQHPPDVMPSQGVTSAPEELSSAPPLHTPPDTAPTAYPWFWNTPSGSGLEMLIGFLDQNFEPLIQPKYTQQSAVYNLRDETLYAYLAMKDDATCDIIGMDGRILGETPQKAIYGVKAGDYLFFVGEFASNVVRNLKTGEDLDLSELRKNIELGDGYTLVCKWVKEYGVRYNDWSVRDDETGKEIDIYDTFLNKDTDLPAGVKIDYKEDSSGATIDFNGNIVSFSESAYLQAVLGDLIVMSVHSASSRTFNLYRADGTLVCSSQYFMGRFGGYLWITKGNVQGYIDKDENWYYRESRYQLLAD